MAATVQQVRRRLPDMLATLTLSTGIGYIAAAYTVSRWLTRPTRVRLRRTPADLNLPFEKLTCKTVDGVRLAGWCVSPPQPRATIAIFHGLRNHREKTLERIGFLSASGYRCVAFDHRAHGESSGRRSSFGFHERCDVLAVMDTIKDRWPNEPIVAIGMSMGAAALCFAAERTRDCAALILEGCYHDIRRAFENRLSTTFPSWVRRLSRGVVWVTERRLGISLDQLAPCDHIASLAPAPVFFITGNEDHHATPEEARLLYERCQGPRELWLVPNAGHRDIFEIGGVDYQRRVLEFLERHV